MTDIWVYICILYFVFYRQGSYGPRSEVSGSKSGLTASSVRAFQSLSTVFFRGPYIFRQKTVYLSRKDRIFSARTVYFTFDPVSIFQRTSVRFLSVRILSGLKRTRKRCPDFYCRFPLYSAAKAPMDRDQRSPDQSPD